MMKIKSSNFGITLIALVVTIIVLMILSGVAVAILMRRKWNNNKAWRR